MTKRLLRLLRIAPLALLFAGIASAQTTGTIIGVVTDASTGKPVAGAVVIATSPSLQGEQTAITDGNGNYRFVLLPPGEYKLGVQLEGFKPFERSDIVVRLDKTIRAPLSVVPEAVQMEEQVVRTGAAPVVNIGSAESGSVVSSEFMASIPVGRSFDAIAVVAPTAQSDTYGVGFAGAQSPENTYILDGMNVADPVYGSLSTNILSNFVEEIDVKTGNFSAEYGRATGGVVNVVAKSGSNEYHGSVFSNFTPSFLVQPDGEVVGLNGQAIASKTVASEGSYDLDFGAEVGGPVLKDKLWFYAGFAPVITERYTERFLRANVLDGTGNLQQDSNGNFINQRIPGASKVYNTGSTAYQFAGKLTYLLDENHQVSASTYLVPGNRTGLFATNGAETRRTFEVDEGSYNVLGRYGGKFLDKKLIVELQGGWHRTKYADQPTDFQRETPAMQWRAASTIPLFGGAGRAARGWQFRDFAGMAGTEPLLSTAGAQAACAVDNACIVQDYTTGGYSFGEDYNADRLAARLSASYLLEAFGSHNWKAGIDLERNTYDIAKFYSGGQHYRVDGPNGAIWNIRGFGRVLNAVNGDPDFESTVVEWIDTERSESVTNSFAYYLQDSWLIPNTNVTLNAGIRLETQTMEGTSAGGIKGIDIGDMWAPRLQAIWDFTGTGRGKVGASWGRFYYAIPLDMGDRAFGNEESADGAWDCGDVTPNSGLVPTDPEAAGCAEVPDFVASAPNVYLNVGGITPVQPDLKGIYVDQWGAQFEYELLSDLSIGFDYQGRRQGSTIEDMSDNDGNTYFIGNPGEGSSFEATYLPGSANSVTETKNPKQVTSADPFTRRSVTVNFPKPTRDYDGFTFKVTKNFSQSWLAAASYTYSALRGNYAGVFRPEDGQLDPGITSEYDLASLMANRKGFLPGDVPHTVKLFGAYTYNFGRKLSVTGSGAFNGASGTPVNALGAHNLYGAGQAFIVQRGGAGRTPFRTTFDLGGRLEYTIRAPYAVRFSVDVFNLFNSQKAVNYDQNYTTDQVLPVSNINCESDAAGSSNPIAKIQSDCPDLAYLKTVDGRPVSVNPNFGKPAATTTAFQNPLSLRIGLALTF